MEKNDNQNNYGRVNFASHTVGAKQMSDKRALVPPSLKRRLTGKSKKLPNGKVIASLAVLLALVFASKPILSFGTSTSHTPVTTTNNFAVNLNSPSPANVASTSSPQVLGDQTVAASSSVASTTQAVPTPTPQPAVVNNKVMANLKINSTPTGFLNVRSSPSIDGTIITKIYPGKIYGYIQSQGGWFEISLSGSQTGWVDGQYVTAPYTAQAQTNLVRHHRDYDPAGEDAN